MALINKVLSNPMARLKKSYTSLVYYVHTVIHTHTEPFATPLQAVPGRVIIMYISSLQVKLSNRDGSKVSITSIKPLQNQASFFSKG